MRDLYLAIDVGTGSLRAALVERRGTILAMSSREHEQIVPQFGWSEQRPADWWAGTVEAIRDVLTRVENAPARVSAICACGQMHGTVLIDADGQLTRETVPLWNDKRTLADVGDFAARHAPGEYLARTANPPSPAWPAFKLRWLAAHDPAAMAATRTVLMPKDWINFKLTGVRAQDRTEGSMSFLMDAATRDWSGELLALAGISRDLLPPLRDPVEVLGGLTPQAAARLGLAEGLPVLVGGGDYPVALLGSGVMAPGMASDVTGTSTIVTLLHDAPVIDPEVSNVATVEGNWGSLTLLDAGGDAMRWARRAFHENRRSYAEIADAARHALPGSGKLFFLPYLSGERFGEYRNSRAQFFGLTAAHGLPELHRAVLEGVAFSVRLRLGALQAQGRRPERFVAASGGAKSDLWLRIKASMYRVPYLVPRELECGVIGAAAMMAVAVGDAPDLAEAVRRMVVFDREILPEPEWADCYDRMMPIYEKLYAAAQPFYAELDALI
uniref:xylulokinase n=1 Tax=Paracoccus sp. TRP TaxID=412597 RepID=UPI000225F0A3|nr:FGGY family carbohydrate kinase [Paracoccus sp. TRP]